MDSALAGLLQNARDRFVFLQAELVACFDGKGAGVVGFGGSLQPMDQVAVAAVAGIRQQAFPVVDENEAVEIAVQVAGAAQWIASAMGGENGFPAPSVARDDIAATEGFQFREPGFFGLQRVRGGCEVGHGEKPEIIEEAQGGVVMRAWGAVAAVKGVEKPARQPRHLWNGLFFAGGDVQEQVGGGPEEGGAIVEIGATRAG